MFKNSWPLVMFAVTLAASNRRTGFADSLHVENDEASFQTPVSNTATSGTVTSGTINPGIIYTSKTYQVAVEAVIPVNRQSGTSVGIIGQLHFYLDDIFPKTLGRPIFANNINTGRPMFGR
jgi:hypothetical protein